MTKRHAHQRTHRGTLQSAALFLAVLVAATGLASAEVVYDVSVGLKVGDDARLFLNLTNEHYAPPERVATSIVRRCAHPGDDYPVILFLAGAGGVSPNRVLDLRLNGGSWAEIMFRLNIGPRILFAQFDRDPGPPYGKAWGHYRSHRPGRKSKLSDRDIVELTKLQIAARYYGVSPYTIVSERKKGVSVESFAAKKHGRKHGGQKAKQAGHQKKSGKAKGKPNKH